MSAKTKTLILFFGTGRDHKSNAQNSSALLIN
nr:MAG TPA: hypothetical protein [Bacteriophage sp.]